MKVSIKPYVRRLFKTLWKKIAAEDDLHGES